MVLTAIPVRRLEEFLGLLPDDCSLVAGIDTLRIHGPNRAGDVVLVGRIALDTRLLHWYQNHHAVERFPVAWRDICYAVRIVDPST